MAKKFKINEKAVRSAITTLFKNELVKKTGWNNEDFANDKMTMIINIDSGLTMTKKKLESIIKHARMLTTFPIKTKYDNPLR